MWVSRIVLKPNKNKINCINTGTRLPGMRCGYVYVLLQYDVTQIVQCKTILVKVT